MRDVFFTLPDRLKLAWRAFAHWWHAAVLAWIDRYLQRHDQERTYTLLDFEDLPTLFDEQDFQVVAEQGDWPRWQENR